MKRLIPLSIIRQNRGGADSLRERQRLNRTQGRRDEILLQRAEECWNNLAPMRATRHRNLRYVFGDQWADFVLDRNGHPVSERQRIAERTGGVVLQNNHLVKIVNTLGGVYSKSATQPTVFARVPEADEKSEMMTNALQANWEINQMPELMSAGFTELICGGLEVMREDWDIHEGDEDAFTYLVNSDYVFFDLKGLDPRHWDVDLIGEIKDYTLGELATLLAESETDYDQLRAIYANDINQGAATDGFPVGTTFPRVSGAPTDIPSGPSWRQSDSRLCRTYHVWTHEHKLRYRCVDRMDFVNPVYRIELSDLPRIKAENEARLAAAAEQGMNPAEVPLIEYSKVMDQYWHFTMLSPEGYVLQEYDSPFEHHSHPYSLRAHNLVNGQFVPFISCIIDQQRYINRLITLQDLIMNSAAKGVWKVPKDCLGDMSEEEFAEHATEIGGIIFYTPNKMGKEPEQVFSNASLVGTSELLALQLQSINEITSVSESLQGKTPKANTAASRYAMEVQNSTTSIATLLTKQTALERSVARKKMEVIHQFYNEPRPLVVPHPNGYVEYAEYQPRAVRDIKYYVNVRETEEAAVSRLAVNDIVSEMWAAGQLTPKQRLTLSYIPGAQAIIKALEQNGTADQTLDPQALAQGQQATSNNAAQAAPSTVPAASPAGPLPQPASNPDLVDKFANRQLPIR